MDFNVIQQILDQVSNYVTKLDWAYIITLIIILYGLNHCRVKKEVVRILGIRMSNKVRVVFIGLIYGIGIFFIRGYRLAQVEMLLQSFIFSIVFHKLIVDTILQFLMKHKALPKAICKHIINEGKNI